MMLFNNKKGIAFSLQESIYNNKELYFSESVISTLELDKSISPYGCTGVDNHKIKAFKKGYSESLDRRANMIYKFLPDNNIKTYSLIDKKIVNLNSNFASFRNTQPIIDTTGTAAHPRLKTAFKNSLYELLQKNSFFIFWYGKNNGVFIENFGSEKEIYILEDTFSPVMTVININFRKNHFSMGLGTDTNIGQAIKLARDERMLLENLSLNDISDFKDSFSFYNKININFIKKKLLNITKKEIYINTTLKQENIIEKLPSWLKDLRVYIIPQEIGRVVEVDTVKIYSSQLYLCVPKKSSLDLDKDINTYTLNLSESDLKNIPEIPMI